MVSGGFAAGRGVDGQGQVHGMAAAAGSRGSLQYWPTGGIQMATFGGRTLVSSEVVKLAVH